MAEQNSDERPGTLHTTDTALVYELRNYRLEAQVEQEELATVYRATHLTLNRPVLVHILRRTDWVSVSRFQLAARLAAQLSHPNLLPVIDAGHDDAYGDYLVTPLFEGMRLNELAEQQAPLEPLLVLRIATQLAAVLDELHAQHVVHRDVQPANVLLTPEGVAYLGNLSLAASPDTPDLSSVDEADYLTAYSAPEQRLDQSESCPTLDVYGLGALLYHLLSGDVPPAPGLSLAPLLSSYLSLADVDHVLRRMLALEPGERYASAGEAVAALRRALHAHIDRASEDMEESRWEPAAEWLENPLETVLGDMLDTEFVGKSHARADALHRGDSIRRLLTRWSRRGFVRRPALGHVIQLEQVVSYSIYFYEVQMLYETREPLPPARHPQRADERPSLGSPPSLWEAPVPEVASPMAEAKPQEVVWAHTTRVQQCEQCESTGAVVCSRCGSKGSIARTREVRTPDNQTRTETVPEMCPTCHGYRQQRCPVCEGSGALVEHDRFRWARRACLWKHTDDMEELPRLALAQRAQDVFCAPINPFEGRWHSVAPLAELLREATAEVGHDTRIIGAELRIRGVPLTEIDYQLGKRTQRLYLVGFDNEVVGTWALLNMERVLLLAVGGTVLLLLLVIGVVLLLP